MRQAELDIVTADGTRYNDTMEVDSSADLTDIVTAARRLSALRLDNNTRRTNTRS